MGPHTLFFHPECNANEPSLEQEATAAVNLLVQQPCYIQKEGFLSTTSHPLYNTNTSNALEKQSISWNTTWSGVRPIWLLTEWILNTLDKLKTRTK